MDHRAGGVEVATTDGKVKAVNTMESRLEMIYQQVKPAVVGKQAGSGQFLSLPLIPFPLFVCPFQFPLPTVPYPYPTRKSGRAL